MDTNEILTMPAGKKMDALIYKFVFDKLKEIENAHLFMNAIPRYSTDIAAAWKVVAELNRVKNPNDNYEDYKIWTVFHDKINEINIISLSESEAVFEICRAALLAVMERV